MEHFKSTKKVFCTEQEEAKLSITLKDKASRNFPRTFGPPDMWVHLLCARAWASTHMQLVTTKVIIYIHFLRPAGWACSCHNQYHMYIDVFDRDTVVQHW